MKLPPFPLHSSLHLKIGSSDHCKEQIVWTPAFKTQYMYQQVHKNTSPYCCTVLSKILLQWFISDVETKYIQEPLKPLHHNPALSPAWALTLPNQSYTPSPSPNQDKGPCSSILSQAGRCIWMGGNPGEGKKLRDVKMVQFSFVIKYQHTGSPKRWAGTWNRAGSLWAQAWL